MEQKDAHKLLLVMGGLMVFSLIIYGLWDQIEIIKNSVHAVLDPSFGILIKMNAHLGILALSFVVSFITVLVQKYATDQASLKKIKDEQKEIQNEMKKDENKKNQKKQMELQKQMFEKMPKMMAISMRGAIFTAIPFILLIRWLRDIFSHAPLEGTTFLGVGFVNWLFFYILTIIVASTVLRKILKVH